MVTTYETDYYNLRGRNSRNTDLDDYNCGGFALGTFNWYLPYASWSETTDNLYFRRHMNTDAIVRYYANYILLDFGNRIREIKSVEELKVGERAIAFRAGVDDFHFCVRGKNGVWYHKPGRNTIRRIKRSEVFAEEWVSPDHFVVYDSEIILFALKNQKKPLTKTKIHVIILIQ